VPGFLYVMDTETIVDVGVRAKVPFCGFPFTVLGERSPGLESPASECFTRRGRVGLSVGASETA